MFKLILASNSPRRKDLLNQIQIDFVVEPADIEEVLDETHTAQEAVQSLALQKAQAVAAKHNQGIVLGADTLIELEGQQLGKPQSSEEAKEMLAKLSGKTHKVLTGVALIDAKTKRTLTQAEITEVKIGQLSQEEIDWYVESGEPFDKAGSYAIQGLAARFVEKVDGCYNNVLGLPLYRVVQMLKVLSHD